MKISRRIFYHHDNAVQNFHRVLYPRVWKIWPIKQAWLAPLYGATQSAKKSNVRRQFVLNRLTYTFGDRSWVIFFSSSCTVLECPFSLTRARAQCANCKYSRIHFSQSACRYLRQPNWNYKSLRAATIQLWSSVTCNASKINGTRTRLRYGGVVDLGINFSFVSFDKWVFRGASCHEEQVTGGGKAVYWRVRNLSYYFESFQKRCRKINYRVKCTSTVIINVGGSIPIEATWQFFSNFSNHRRQQKWAFSCFLSVAWEMKR